MAAEDLGATQGERDSRIPGYPRRVPGPPSLDHTPSSGSYPAGAVWLAIADQLAASSDVTTTTDWRQMTAVLLSYGHYWTTVTRRR